MLVLRDNAKLNAQVRRRHWNGILVYLPTLDNALNIYGRIFCIWSGPDKNSYTIDNSIQCIARCEVKFTLEQATNAQRWSRGIALLFL